MQSAKTRICSGPTALFSRSSERLILAAAVTRVRSWPAQYNPVATFTFQRAAMMRFRACCCWRWRLAPLAVPAFAQNDLSGEWIPVQEEDNTGNTELGDWVGIPMNDASRLRSAAWDASIQTLPEWQCRPHGSAYISRGPSQLKIWKEVDPSSRDTVAWHLEWLRSVDRPVYMDGRPHPSPNAPHTWAGFSTGEWMGETLRVRVTHVKEEYLKRNGVWHSDEIELTQYLIRRGDIPDVRRHRLRPGVSHRAAHPQHRVPPRAGVSAAAVPVHGGHRGRSAGRRRAASICRAPTTTSAGSRAATRFR